MSFTNQTETTIMNNLDPDLGGEGDSDSDSDNLAADGGPTAGKVHHQPSSRPSAPRLAEMPPMPAPRRSPFSLPDDPKHIDGRQLDPETRNRDRDMLSC